MPAAFLGDGLIFEDLLPLGWVPGPLPEGLELARINADNHQLLGAEASLEEVRVAESLTKEESPALVHELQRLEYKLNVLLRLTADLVARSSAIPTAQRVRLSSRGLEWAGAAAPQPGASGLLSLYINPALPQPLRLPCEVMNERAQNGERVAFLEFRELSEAVTELLEKLIFRHHRRLIAGARTAGV